MPPNDEENFFRNHESEFGDLRVQNNIDSLARRIRSETFNYNTVFNQLDNPVMVSTLSEQQEAEQRAYLGAQYSNLERMQSVHDLAQHYRDNEAARTQNNNAPSQEQGQSQQARTSYAYDPVRSQNTIETLGDYQTYLHQAANDNVAQAEYLVAQARQAARLSSNRGTAVRQSNRGSGGTQSQDNSSTQNNRRRGARGQGSSSKRARGAGSS